MKSGGGGGAPEGKLSHRALKSNVMERTAALWGCTPQVGERHTEPKRVVEAKYILHNTQTTDIFVPRFTLYKEYKTNQPR